MTTDDPRQRPVERLLGESQVLLEVLEQVSQIAPLDKPVLVVGERGTGKELIAERLHYLSGRWDQTFLKMNCIAISESLLETELFGHDAGAFTGATRQHKGRFERAHLGSLFLDELATTSPLVQQKLLRVIEYGEFERVGGSRTLQTDVRLIAATNEDLPGLARQGRFREDLLDRLAFDVITLPPLRARQDDILILADQFALAMSIELGRSYFAGFSDRAKEEMVNHSWPGNVRELKNAVERSVYRQDEEEAMVDHILLDPFASPFRLNLMTAEGSDQSDQETGREEKSVNSFHRTSGLPVPTPESPIDLRDLLRNRETELINLALIANQFNQKRTAEALGVTYHQLRGYLKKYDLLE